MNKKYIVRLNKEEQKTLRDIIKKMKGSAEKVKRAQILLKADVNGSNWTDERIAEAFLCRVTTVHNVRRQLVTEGFERVLNRKKRKSPPRKKILDGEQEAKLIALRLGPPPKGFGSWSLRLLANQVVELGIVDSISHTTVSTTLKKTK